MRILIPIDFSTNAYNALKYAKHLFAGQACTFYLLHTYTPAVYRSDYLLESPGQIGLGDVIKYNAEQNLEKMRIKISEDLPDSNHQFVLHTAFNTLTEEIDEQCTSENIDLVVMGTQGATGAAEIFLGTHTVHAIKKVSTPLLVIPPQPLFKPIKKLLFPTDYEIDYENDSMAFLLSLVKTLNAHIDVLHIARTLDLSKEQNRHQGQLRALIKKYSYSIHNWGDQELIPAIAKFMNEHQSDMLVMARNKHSFFDKLFIEPVINKIAFHTDKPFLVIPMIT